MSWNKLTEEEKRQAEERFISLSQKDDIRRSILEEGRSRRYGFGDIYQFVISPDYEMTPELQQQIERNSKLQEALDQLMSAKVIYQFPRAAAASSGALESREGDGFSIVLRESRAQPDQIYVILKMEDLFEVEPTALILKTNDGKYLKKGLPLGVDGVFQFLVERNDAFMLALQDAASEVYLN